MQDIAGSSKPLVTGSFPDRAARARYDSLRQRGYSRKTSRDDVQRRHRVVPEGRAEERSGQQGARRRGVGCGVGGAVGATLLAILAAVTALTLPGIGSSSPGRLPAPWPVGGRWWRRYAHRTLVVPASRRSREDVRIRSQEGRMVWV